MCESCFDCPECGQEVPEKPRSDYWLGLSIPILAGFLAVHFMHEFSVFGDRTFWLTIGALGAGAWFVVVEDPHAPWNRPE